MRLRPDDELLAPSLQAEARVVRPPAGERPWRLSSQVYVGFFGGALAVAALAWANARRLHAPRETQRWIVVLGGLGVVVSVVVSYVLYGDDFGRSARLGYRIVGVLLAGALYKLQEPADRVYSFRTPGDDDEQYDPMWAPGLLATFVGGAAQLALVFAGMGLLDAVAG